MQRFRMFQATWGLRHVAALAITCGGFTQAIFAQSAPYVPAPSASSSDEKTVKLKFFNADWPTVLNTLAEQSGSTLVLHEAPDGHFTRRDKTEYTRNEAVQILNRELEPEGFRILEKQQFLIVVHQRSLRTKYRRPERPTEPEWQQLHDPKDQWADFQSPNRKVTPIATRKPAAPQILEVQHQVPAPQPIPTTPAATTNPLASPAPAAQVSTSVPVGWSVQVLTPRNQVRDLAGSLYRALQNQSRLIDSGLNGLPSFRTQFAGPAGQATQGFEVAIDVPKNQIVMAAPAVQLKQLAGFFQFLDRETNQFAEPIRLIAADSETATLAQKLTPQIKKLAKHARQNGNAGIPKPNNNPNDWLLAQAPENPLANPQPGNNPPPAGDPQVVPVQPQPEGIQAIIANFRGDVQIQAIPDLGIMILKGNQADVNALIKIIQQIQTQTAGVAPDVDVLLLENLNSEALVELLRSVYEQLETLRTRSGEPRQRVSFIPIARPNAVMILAPKVEIESIRELAIKLDVPLDPKSSIQVFPLKSAVATQAAATLINLYQNQTTTGTTTTNNAGAVPTALAPRIQVVADVRTNSLIVHARPNDLKEVALVISKLDRDHSAAVSKMRVVPLKNAVADELANVITSTLQGLLNQPTVTGTPPQGQVNNQAGNNQGAQELRDAKSVILEFLSSVGDTKRTVRSGILADIRVQPDIRSNSLIVTAPEQSLEMMVALIERLDQPTSTVAEIKVFTLENADASSMIELLTTLFEQDDNTAAAGVQIIGAEDASSGLIPLRFSVDIRTNSIIAIGGGDALRVVEAILLRLDESDIRQRETTVIKLRNSPATDVAAAINTFLQSQRDLAAIDPELVSNTELLEREIIAVAEPVSNSLLISATPRYYKEIQELIQKLDAEPPQVVIQALLVEVTLDNTDEFGVELGFQDDILFDRSITAAEDLLTISQTNTSPNGVQTTSQQIISQAATPGFRFNDPAITTIGNNISGAPNLVGSQSLSNFSLGRVNNELGFGGLVLSASSNQVSMLLRALAARRQVHILSRPQIRTLDNQVAQIQVGQQVPVVDGVSFQGANNSAFPIVRQDNAGIILTVTPRISPEENIVMEVVAEKSAFTGAGVPIFVDSVTGNTISSPIKDITTARTTVGVPNGQTIVLGGMITKNEETLERKVPWLGDMPYLGMPFRYDSTRTRRTELLIFLTPRVVRGAADNELIKQVEAERTHFIEQEAEELHGPLFSIPGVPSGEYCPPGEFLPGTWEDGEEVMPAAPSMPTPAMPAVPAPGPQGAYKNQMGQVPTNIVPAGGFPQNSKAQPPTTAKPAARKRPWYSLGR